MNLVKTDYIAIIIFAIVLAGFAYFVRRSESYTDFAVGNKTFGVGLLTASFVATLIGPGFSIGMVGRGFSTGLYFLLGAIAYGVGYYLFGKFLAPKFAQMKDSVSLGEVMEKKYGVWGKQLTGLLSFVLLTGFVAIMVNVASDILSGITGLSVTLSAIVSAVLVAFYTLFGGMKTSVYTDVFQTAVFGTVLLVLLFATAGSAPIGLGEAVANGVSLGTSELAGMSFFGITGFVFTMMFGEVFLPPVIGRALSAESAEAGKRSFTLTGMIVPIVLGAFLLMGIYAGGGLVEAGTASDDVIMGLASGQFGSGMLGLFVVALLSVVLSSMDSLLQAGAVTITSDVAGFSSNSGNNRSLVTSRIATIVLAVLGTGLALVIPDLISTLLIIYSLWVPVIMVPLFYALFSDRVTAWAGPLAMIFGGAGSYVWEYLLSNPIDIPGAVFGTILALITIEITTLVSKNHRSDLNG
jgi:SSS family solute:Na+ symporter